MAKDVENATTVAQLFEAHMILTANDRLRMLGGALKGGSLKEYRQKVIDYQQDIVPDRNRLGHMVLVATAKPTAVTDAKGNEMSVERTRALRCQILELRGEFRNLLVALQG